MIKRKLNKKGINQIEYIAAMLIFIFGLVVVMYFVLTFDIAQRQDYLTTIENNFKKETQIEYWVYYLTVNDAGNCFEINLPEGVNTNDLTIISNNEKIGFQDASEGKIYFDGGNSDYQFIIAEGHNYNIPDLTDCLQTNAIFSIKEKKIALDYNKIKQDSNLNKNYTQNYEQLKKEIAEGKDFTIKFENIGDCIDYHENPPKPIKIPGLMRYVPHNAQVTAGKFPARVFVNPNLICDVNVLIKIW